MILLLPVSCNLPCFVITKASFTAKTGLKNEAMHRLPCARTEVLKQWRPLDDELGARDVIVCYRVQTAEA